MLSNVFSSVYDFVKSFANAFWLDGAIYLSVGLVVILTIVALVYKIASFDYDVIFASSTVLKYLSSAKTDKSDEALSYQMRFFPSPIQWAYQAYLDDKTKRPSDKLKTELVSKETPLDALVLGAFRFVSLALVFLSLAAAFADDTYTLSARLLVPLLVGTLCLVFYYAVKFFFDLSKRRAFGKFQKLVSSLNFRHFVEEKRLESARIAAENSRRLQEEADAILKRHASAAQKVETLPDSEPTIMTAPVENKSAKELIEDKIDEVIEKIEKL